MDEVINYTVMAYDVPFKKHPVLSGRVLTHEEEYGEFESLRAALKFCKWKSAKNNQWTGAPHPFHLFYISEYIGEDDPLPQHKSAEEWEEDPDNDAPSEEPFIRGDEFMDS